MKLTISLCVLFIAGTTMAFPQTSFYASNRKQVYPQLLPRFGADDTNIDTRFGENNPTTTSGAPTITNSNTQTDSLHDPDVVSRVATWPKERQPFWYLNSQHITGQRGQNVPCTNCVNQNLFSNLYHNLHLHHETRIHWPSDDAQNLPSCSISQ